MRHQKPEVENFNEEPSAMKWISIAVICLTAAGALGQSEPSSEPSTSATTRSDHSSADDKIIVTYHSLVLGTAKIDYQASPERL